MADEIYEFGMSDFRIISSNFMLKMDKKYDLANIHDIEIAFNTKYEFVVASNTLNLSMKIEITGDEMPFTLAIEALSTFEFNNKVEDPTMLGQVAEINCASITFPYLREVVADTVRRGGLPPLHLPAMNFVDMYAQKQKRIATSDTATEERKTSGPSDKKRRKSKT